MAAQSSQQQGADNSLAMLWGIGLAFAALGFLWVFFHDKIAYFILRIRFYEASFIAWWLKEAHLLPVWIQSQSVEYISLRELLGVSKAVGYYLRYPTMLSLGIYAVLIYRGRATVRFNKRYTMDLLVHAEKQNWAQINPIVQLNLVNTDIDHGLWAMALTPLEFAKKNNLLHSASSTSVERSDSSPSQKKPLSIKLKKEEAHRVFSTQLGDYWPGVDHLPVPIQALFAIFSAKAARDSASANHLLWQISASAKGIQGDNSLHFMQHLDFSGTHALLKKYAHDPAVIRVTQRHAYTLTVMASMLALAREDGVLASAEFLWLKPVDRVLWFMLNCVGRQTAFPEIAGPFAHWIVERAVGHKLSMPMIDSALQSLELALLEVRLPNTDVLKTVT